MIQALRAWLWKSGRLEIAVLTGLLLAVAGFWAFGMLAAEVMEGDTQKFDERILLALREPDNLAVPVGPAWTLQVARDLTAFGGAVGLGLITGIVAGYLYLQRRYGLLGFVLLSVFSGTGLALVLKEIFQRPRPQIVPHLTDITTASFPSGHSMLSSVVYLTLAALLARVVPDRRTKVYFLLVAPFLVLLIGSSRVYLGVHYPTDVLAGWCLGSVWALLCCMVAHFVATSRLVAGAEELSEEKGGRETGPTGT